MSHKSRSRSACRAGAGSGSSGEVVGTSETVFASGSEVVQASGGETTSASTPAIAGEDTVAIGETVGTVNYLVVFSDGAPRLRRGGAVLRHVELHGNGRFEFHSEMCIELPTSRDVVLGSDHRFISSCFWELFALLVGFEMLERFANLSHLDLSTVHSTHIVDNVKCAEFVLDEIKTSDVGAPHLEHMVALCQRQLASLRNRAHTIVIKQAFRHTRGMRHAHRVAHQGPIDEISESLYEQVREALLHARLVMQSASDEEKSVMRNY